MKKINWKKTDWEDFKFWKPDTDHYHPKRWMLSVFGFGLGYWYGMMFTTYVAICACLGLAVFSLIGTIVDMMGESKFRKAHEQGAIDEAMRQVDLEMKKTQEELETKTPEADDEEDVIIIDEKILNDNSEDK